MDGECLKCPSISSPDGLLVSGPGGAPREDGAASSSPAGPFAKEAPQTGGLSLRGSVGPSGNPGALPEVPQVGWAYVAADPGVYGGLDATKGDLIYCVSASPVRWAILQSDSDDAGRDLVRATLSFSADPRPSLSLETETAAGVSSVQTVDVSALAVDESVVHKTGDEIIGGVKTFKNTGVGHTEGATVTDLVIRNPEVTRGVPLESGTSYTRVILADADGDTEETFIGRLGLLEVVSPKEGDTVGAQLNLRCYKYSADSQDAGQVSSLVVGYDVDGIAFASAPATSDERDGSTDIVTRGWRITEAEIDALSS